MKIQLALEERFKGTSICNQVGSCSPCNNKLAINMIVFYQAVI
jgi:hypothetical protein